MKKFHNVLPEEQSYDYGYEYDPNLPQEGYTQLEGKGWDVADKIFNYMGLATNIYGEVKYASQYGNDPYVTGQYQIPRYNNIGILGLPRPYGGLIIGGVMGLVVLGIFRIATK